MIENLIEKLKTFENAGKKGVVGFDGFVDEIVHVVDKRIDSDTFHRIETIEGYGRRISKSAGLSTNIEMVSMQKKLGGNGPIFANSLIHQNVDITYIGALGVPKIDCVFDEMNKRCNMISISNPGHTDAIEFFDGKIISSKLEPLKSVNWESLNQALDKATFRWMIDQADFCAFLNWTLLIHMNEIWEHIIREVLPGMKNKGDKKLLFIDLADPEKRSRKDIMTALTYLVEFNHYFKVVLGLNKKESCEIAQILGMEISDFERADVVGITKFLQEKIPIHTIVVHPIKSACAVSQNECVCIEGPYCKRPRLTTGAGDNFNAGFVLGQISGMNLEESLYLGVANSGYYVRYGKSADIGELSQFLKDWKNLNL